jgi:hypothetical protein
MLHQYDKIQLIWLHTLNIIPSLLLSIDIENIILAAKRQKSDSDIRVSTEGIPCPQMRRWGDKTETLPECYSSSSPPFLSISKSHIQPSLWYNSYKICGIQIHIHFSWYQNSPTSTQGINGRQNFSSLQVFGIVRKATLTPVIRLRFSI